MDQDFNYSDTLKYFIDRKYINPRAAANSQALHTKEFDNFDLLNNHSMLRDKIQS